MFSYKIVISFFLLLVFTLGSRAQIVVPDAIHHEVIRYNDGSSDPLYLVGGTEGEKNISIEASAVSGNRSIFTWEKYNSNSGNFEWFADGATNDTIFSRLVGLEEGCYRVTITDGSLVQTEQVWVLQDWITPSANIPDSTSLCDYFKIVGEVSTAPLQYTDLSTGVIQNLRTRAPELKYRWNYQENPVSTALNAVITDLIASNTPIVYSLTVTDEYTCTGTTQVEYYSKVPKAVFEYSPTEGEAVLEVTFTNSSVNYDYSYWNFSKKWSDIATELTESETGTVDSIKFVLEDDAPIYEYEEVGQYHIYLAVSKENSTGTCYDTTYMERGTYIDVQSSLIDAPNFFTPNEDGENDQFIVRSKSLKSMNIKIYNRWGGLVHSWKYSNIRSNDYTYEHSVWDGKIGRRYASPGVYYYFITAEGRDGIKHKKNGFIHLFREKSN